MRRFTFTRDFYIPQGSVEVRDDQSDAVAYLYDVRGAPCAKIFFGKQAKPVADYRYPSDERRNASIAEHFARNREHVGRMNERRQQRTAFQHTAKVGDIYSTCWGYDQTNVEYFEIIEIRGKHAILREIGVEVADGGVGSEMVTPAKGRFLEPRREGDEQGVPIRRLIQEGRIKIDDVRTASLWTGGARRRTAFGWGH